MKKSIIFFGLLLLALASSNDSFAQSASNPWNGPRWSSVQVTNTLWDWVDANIVIDEPGEWANVNFVDFEKGYWVALISWGSGAVLEGSVTLVIKSNGEIADMY